MAMIQIFSLPAMSDLRSRQAPVIGARHHQLEASLLCLDRAKDAQTSRTRRLGTKPALSSSEEHEKRGEAREGAVVLSGFGLAESANGDWPLRQPVWGHRMGSKSYSVLHHRSYFQHPQVAKTLQE